MHNLKKKAFINLMISYFAIFLGMVNTLFRTQIITAEQIGLIAILMSITGILIFFVQSGFNAIIIKYVCKLKNRSQKGTFIFLSFISMLCLYLIVILVFIFFKKNILKYYQNEMLEKYIMWIIPILLINSLFRQADISLRAFFLANVASFLKLNLVRILHFGLIIIALTLNLSFEKYFVSYISILAINLVILLVYLKVKITIRHFDFSFISLKYFKEILHYGLFMAFGSFVNIITNRVDKLMIGSIVGLSGAGIYTIAILFGNILGKIGEVVVKIFHPKVSVDLSNRNFSELEKDYKDIGRYQLLLGSFLFIFFVFFAGELLSIFGKNYKSGYWVVVCMALGQLINNATSICGGIISYSKYFKFDFYTKFLLLFLNISMNFILIPKYGINGAVIATAVSIHPWDSYIIKLLFNILCMTTYFFLIKSNIQDFNLLGIGLLGFIGFIVHISLLYFTKYFNEKEIDYFKKKVSFK